MLLRALPVLALGRPAAVDFFVPVEAFLGADLALVLVAALVFVEAAFFGAAAFLGAAVVLVFFAAAGFLVVEAGLAVGESFFASFTVPDGPDESFSYGR